VSAKFINMYTHSSSKCMQEPVKKQTVILQVFYLHHGKSMAVAVKGYLHALVGCGDCG
jgi:hypothetical protein